MKVRVIKRVVFPTNNRLHTYLTLLGVKTTIALHTIPKAIAHRESIGGEGPVTIMTGKAFFVPCLSAIEDTPF